MMSQEGYVKKVGNYCPVCESPHIEGHEVEIAAGTAAQEVTCSECSAHWLDHYTLTRFEILEEK